MVGGSVILGTAILTRSPSLFGWAEGASTLAHDNRGRKPANATLGNVIAEVTHQARIQLAELLSELVGIEVGRTILRRILVGAPTAPLESPLW